jgi:hypothetical protein
MARRLNQTMADYVVIAISPALIMGLVGSLVFFLLGVLYQGSFQERLHWVMACFVFAAVLIGRISIEQGFERAAPFGMALALVVGLAANRFLDFQGSWIDNFGWLINWGLIALIWWCAHRLTWDCTVIDDSEDASGQGLLQTAGLEKPLAEDDKPAESQGVEGTTSRQAPAGFWQRYVEGQHRPHAPGVWVVYFSLAALPLFGIGQWLIPESDTAGRIRAFWLLCVYVACGMGLLLTTSFLGLRRYLRQRRIEMPTLMANLWMGTGSVLIVALLVFAALLPRPSAEYPISQLPFTVGSPEQKASRIAPAKREGTHSDEGQSASDVRKEIDPEAKGSSAESPNSDPKAVEQGNRQSEQGTAPEAKGKGKASKGSDRQHSKSNSDAAKDAKRTEAKQTDASEKAPAADKAQVEKPSESQRKSNDQDRDSDGESRQADSPKSQPEQSQPEGSQESSPANPPVSSPASSPQPLQAAEGVAESAAGALALVLRWIFYAAFVLGMAYTCWTYRAEIRAALREMLAALGDFWNGLFGSKRPRAIAAAGEIPLDLPPTPFASYSDPFATGSAGRYSHEELVRYSFEAFEAWAGEHGCLRRADRTPHELVQDVGRLHGFIKGDARALAELYAQAAYARGRLPPNSAEQLERLWRQMRSHTASGL